LKSAGTVKIQGFNSLSKCKSGGGGYHIGYSSPLKMSSKTHLCKCYIC